MIRSYLGEDTQRARREARALFENLRAENPGSTAGYFDDTLFDITLAVDAFTAESLFGGENILYFDGILDHPDGELFYRTIMKETEHQVIIREVSPGKDLRVFFDRLGEVKDFSLVKKFEKRADNFAVVNALAATGRRAEARTLFERLLACRNAHGLLAEHLDPDTGEHWGNFVQTYSMVGLINAAMRLSLPWDDAF